LKELLATATIDPLPGEAMVGVFEIDWTILVSAIGLVISSLAASWYARRQRD
jgi:hypothetical protein